MSVRFSKSLLFLLRYIFLKSINIGPLISHFSKITNHLLIFFLKVSIYIQIIIRLASIHRLSVWLSICPPLKITPGSAYCEQHFPQKYVAHYAHILDRAEVIIIIIILLCACVILKVHKIENFFGSDFEFSVISLLVMVKY